MFLSVTTPLFSELRFIKVTRVLVAGIKVPSIPLICLITTNAGNSSDEQFEKWIVGHYDREVRVADEYSEHWAEQWVSHGKWESSLSFSIAAEWAAGNSSSVWAQAFGSEKSPQSGDTISLYPEDRRTGTVLSPNKSSMLISHWFSSECSRKYTDPPTD